MHHALQIQEILLNIFASCCYELEASDLASLARTCRTFKEPALDVLWEELHDLSPLAQCIPEASHRLPSGEYSFSQLLTQTEWDVLHSYGRRVRSIRGLQGGLDEESLEILSNPPAARPLFPNLRYLRCIYRAKTARLLHLPSPSLIAADIHFSELYPFRDFLQLLPSFAPNIRRICFSIYRSNDASGKFFSDCICQWGNLQTVDCARIDLDMNALVHLSHMPALTHLKFTLSVTLPASSSPLSFSNLHMLWLTSKVLNPISRLLSWIRLPVISCFTATIDKCTSQQELSSFFASLRESNAGHTVQRLVLRQYPLSADTLVHSEAPLLGLDDLRPCMAFSNLRHLSVNIGSSVSLTDGELLTLASAWPNLEGLAINRTAGWHTQGGITPNGLLQLLQSCPSLTEVALVLDTRGYHGDAESSLSGPLVSSGSTSAPTLFINVLDSVIEEESVPAVTAFFARIAHCFLRARNTRGRAENPGLDVYRSRWSDVCGWVNRDAIQCSQTV